jgi:hypothetical protein
LRQRASRVEDAMPAKLTSVDVAFKLPGIELKGVWVADETQSQAAWELYIELVTRIAVQRLGPDDGLVREAMTSLHSLFGETRRILRTYGPQVARPAQDGALTLGAIAVDVLNALLRPFLASWHPLLQAHEQTRRPEVSTLDHERAWSRHDELRAALDLVRERMTAYADLLAKAANVESLHT